MELTLQIDDMLLSQLKGVAKNMSVQTYVENFLRSTFLSKRKKADNTVVAADYEVSPFVKSLSLKGVMDVPGDVNGIDSLIQEKFIK